MFSIEKKNGGKSAFKSNSNRKQKQNFKPVMRVFWTIWSMFKQIRVKMQNSNKILFIFFSVSILSRYCLFILRKNFQSVVISPSVCMCKSVIATCCMCFIQKSLNFLQNISMCQFVSMKRNVFIYDLFYHVSFVTHKLAWTLDRKIEYKSTCMADDKNALAFSLFKILDCYAHVFLIVFKSEIRFM